MSNKSNEKLAEPFGVVFSVAIALSLLFAVSSLLGIPSLWGINFLKFRPTLSLVSALLILVVSFLPVINRRLACAFESASTNLARRRGSRLRLGFITTLVFVALATLKHQNLPLLGDGSLRASEILDAMWYHPTEFLDQLLHATAFRLIFGPLGLKPTICYRVISIISGVVFIWGALRLAIYVLPKHSVFAFFAAVTSGMAVLFFGYVESYSILAGLIPWLALAAIKVIDGKSSVWTFAVWVIIGVLIHSVTLFLFGLPFIASVVMTRVGDEKRRRKYFAIGACTIAAGTIAWYTLAYLGVGSAGRYLLPVIARGEPGQGLLTVDHGLNLLNWLFLSALPFLLYAPYLFLRKDSEVLWHSNRRLLAVTMVVSSLWFLFFFNPQLGGPRDWDLFSLPTFTLIPAVLLYLSTINIKQRLLQPLIPIMVISLVLTWSFATVNASLESSVDRYLEILDVSRFKNQWIEYGQLHELASQRPELQHRRVEFILKAWNEPPRTRTESALTATKVAQAYFDLGRRDSANAFIDSAIAIDSFYLDAYAVRLRALTLPAEKELALATAAAMVRLMPDSTRARREAGMVDFRFGETERGLRNFEVALDLDPNDYLSLMNLGSYYLSADTGWARSIDYLSRAVLQRPRDFTANYYLAMAFEKVGRLDQARLYLQRAAGLAANREQQAAVQSMMARITGG